MTLMSGHHIDFVALDLALQDDRGATNNDPLAESTDHRPGIILVADVAASPGPFERPLPGVEP
jgi:hypothetical protein